VKEFLSREGYAFDAKNIDADDTAYDELMAFGARSVPAIVIDGQVITGYDPVRLQAALAAAAGGS
jgi:glutaredoxin